MPARKKPNKMKRKKPAGKNQNQPQLQFLESNDDHSDVPTTSRSRRSEVELDDIDNDVIESSQPTVTQKLIHCSLSHDVDEQLKDAGMFEDGLTDSQKEDILTVLSESRKMAKENESFDNCADGADDLFRGKGPFSQATNCISTEKLEEAIEKDQTSDSDDGFVITGPTKPKERRMIKPRNIFSTFSLVKETTNSVRRTENTTDLELVSLDDTEGTVAKTDSNTPESKKSIALKNRPLLLRPNSSASRKQTERDSRESPALNHIPLFAPSDMAPRTYTQVIRGYFDNYIESVSQLEQILPRSVSWSNPVVVGRHNKFTIDALRPGQRARNVELWYQMAMKGCRSDNTAINPKKPRLESESETSMTIDDDYDDECGKEDELKNYLNDEPELNFQPEKSQKSYGRRKLMDEEPIFLVVPPDDDDDSENNTPVSKCVDYASNHKPSLMEEDENHNVNPSSQSYVKKFMGFRRKENNASFFSGKNSKEKKGKSSALPV